MTQLTFEDFIICFRRQFVFQTGRGGNRICKYYTAKNQEQGLKNDKWAIMAFIHCATFYEFETWKIKRELKIRPSLYDILNQEVEEILSGKYHDPQLQKKVLIKIGLVKNCINWNFKRK